MWRLTRLFGVRAGSDLSPVQRVAVAASAGVATSFVSTPSELVIIQQQVRVSCGTVPACCLPMRALICAAQRTCAPLLATAKGLIKEHGAGVLLRGAVPCMLRESAYTAGYLGTAPLVTGLLMRSSSLKDSPGTALLLGGMLSGVAASVITQPLDTVKTRMQANLQDPERRYSSLRQGMRTLWCVCSAPCCASSASLTRARAQGGGRS